MLMKANLISYVANKKNIVILLFFIVFAWILLAITPNFYSYYDHGMRNTTYMYLAGVALFFIHNVVLVPIKFKENNNRHYRILLIACIISFILLELYFFIDIISRMSNPGSNVFGLVPDRLFSVDSLLKIVTIMCIPLLVLAALSAIYCLLVFGFRVISPYLEIFVHLVVWMLLLTLKITVPELKSNDIALFFLLALVFYIHTFWLTPILLHDKKTISYLLGISFLVLGYFLFYTILLAILGFPIFNPETGNPFLWTDLPELIFTTSGTIVLFTVLFLSFVYGYFRAKTKSNEKIFSLKLNARESELNLLKAQVNPHFLFNALNSLYATALTENAEVTGASIIKLANLIRYMQNDINKDFIPLENEVKYICDYIDFQRLRCAVDPIVDTHFEGIETQKISPGLFIPFVENAFKYGIDPSQVSKLLVSIRATPSLVYFCCENSYNDERCDEFSQKGWGIGIKNVRKRLDLVYPEHHTVELVRKNGIFSASLSIYL